VNASNSISSFDFRGGNNLLAGQSRTPGAGVLPRVGPRHPGLTGTGSGPTQNFHAQFGATRVYLGFPDAPAIPALMAIMRRRVAN
jgi:hypothetical protein